MINPNYKIRFEPNDETFPYAVYFGRYCFARFAGETSATLFRHALNRDYAAMKASVVASELIHPCDL